MTMTTTSSASPQPQAEVKLRLGTRESPLAMAQAVETRARLCAAHGWPETAIELVPVKASGDKVLDRPLAEIGGKALWTKELDQWLAEGRIDASVHSAKDVETIRPEQFAFAAVLPRADRRDVLVGAPSIAAIPQGAIVGTSAPRRAAQLLNLRPDCKVVMFRGNVATRLGKLEAGEADVTFLAAAGLQRLGEEHIGTPLDSQEWIPAAAQGAIVIEACPEREETFAAISAIDDTKTRCELMAERALLAHLGGNCHSPVAAECHWSDGQLNMKATLFSPDGAERVDASSEFNDADATALFNLASDLLARASANIAQHFVLTE